MNINELHSLAINGDKKAEEKLFHQLSDRFYYFIRQRVGSKDDNEEIVQDALTTIAEQYKNIKFHVSFSAWAYRVLENKLNSFYRRKYGWSEKRAELHELGLIKENWIPDLNIIRRLLKCLKKVSKANIKYSRVLNLHYQGYTVKEIGKTLTISDNAVYLVLSRARKALLECLAKEEMSDV
ncbi:MAG: RNA polymerase sigma factor [candidate division Zixibacteria bacterium]